MLSGDPHIVVTGAGTGIGRAIAQRLASEGARLTLMARDAARLEETLRSLGDSAVGSGVASVDIRDAAAVAVAFDAAVAARGPLRALVANAGIGGPNGPADPGGDRFDDLVATNLTGTYACLRAAERHLEADGEACRLVVVSSILARIGVAGYSGYCASKAALLGLVRALAQELAPRGVAVNAVAPGWVDTAMAREGLEGMAGAIGVSVEEAHAIAMRDVPLGRMGEPAEVAGLVSFLLSADARGITGQALDMNGGAWMG